MQIVIVLSAVLAVAVARPGFLAPVQHQYHAQDELGQYTYGYSGGPSAKVESRSADGVTRGAYSYVDSNGIVQNVNYEADSVNGFRVAATNLPVGPAPVVAPAVAVAAAPILAPVAAVAAPVPVVDTPEVAVARAQHLAIKAAADVNAHVAAVGVVPVPVVDTPEVAIEKSRHLAALASARAAVVDDSLVTDDGSYKPHPLEEDGSYRGEAAQVVVAQSAVGPVAAVVTDDDSHLHDDGSYRPHPLEEDGSYKINPLEDDGTYKGEVAVVGTRLINTIAPIARIGVSHGYVSHPLAYAPAVARYAVASPAINTLAYSAIPATHSQYHAQDELGQYSYGYAGGLSAKHESKTADGVTRGGYSYIDANGIVQSVNYVSDAVNGFRVAATNLPVAAQ